MKTWQLPISSQYPGRGKRVAHYFEASVDTNRQVRSMCGMLFTPGFAEAANSKETSRCRVCSKQLKKEKA